MKDFESYQMLSLSFQTIVWISFKVFLETKYFFTMDQFNVSKLYPSCDSHHKTVEQADSVYTIASINTRIHVTYWWRLWEILLAKYRIEDVDMIWLPFLCEPNSSLSSVVDIDNILLALLAEILWAMLPTPHDHSYILEIFQTPSIR